MPSISSKIVLSSAAQSANVVLADIDLIKGALYGVSTESDLDSINENYLQDGQLMYVQDVSKFFSLTITPANPPSTFVDTYDWNEVVLGQLDTGSFLTSTDTGSFLSSADTGSFILVSQTGSMSVATASYISDTFISASAARSGFGAGSSIDTSSFVLVSVTSSMSVATASYVSPTFISASAAASGFGQGGGDAFPYTGSAGILGNLNLDGVLVLSDQSGASAVAGGLYYNSGDFYVGIE